MGASPGVDDAGLCEPRELLGGALQGHARRRGRQGEDVARLGTGLDGVLRSVGGGPRDGQDRALHGSAHGGMRGVGGGAERVRDVVGADLGAEVEVAEDRPDELGQDHAAVALGAHEQAVGVRLHQVGQHDVVGQRRDGVGTRDEGQVGVRAGVAVGHGEHVEGVDLSPCRGQRLHAELRPRAEGVGSQAQDHGGRLAWATDVAPGTARAIGPAAGASAILTWLPVPRAHLSYVRRPTNPVLELAGVVAVAAVCDVCTKGPGFGHNVSHSHRRTKRRFDPNIQRVRAVVDGTPKRLNVCTSCLKAGKVSR